MSETKVSSATPTKTAEAERFGTDRHFPRRAFLCALRVNGVQRCQRLWQQGGQEGGDLLF